MKMELRRKAIDKLYKRRDKIEMPDFQREEVWPDSKKQMLVDSVLRGWHLPKFYFKRNSDGSYECVDGQQRLNAIFEFYDDKFVLPEQAVKECRGLTYSALPDDASDEFDDFEIEIEEIEDATDDELEELFRRLQLGTPLNTAEKLNAVLGEFRDFCHECTKRPFFKDKLPIKNTRFSHFEIVARWGFIEARGIQPQMRLKQLEQFFRDNKQFSRTSDTAKIIDESLRFLNQAFVVRPTFIANRANTLSVAMLASKVVKANLATKQNAGDFASFLAEFFSSLSAEVQKGVKAGDKELLLYQQSISAGSTGGDSIKHRLEILTRRLALRFPNFVAAAGGRHAAMGSMTNPLTVSASDIRTHYYRANKVYSARHGEDLFKVTNESTNALVALDSPATNKQKYGDLVDGLYFLIYEGSGACKRLGEPPPDFAMDIKFLRTALRHDVDHGDEKDIAKKMKRAGETFAKYSTKRTAEECGEEELLAVQARLLSRCLEMLKKLK
ncbi:MAG: DUF262 domain-containing protein [Opitutaceae bacterium]